MPISNDVLQQGQQVLEGCALFQPLDAEARSQLASHVRQQRLTSGETIFNFGDDGHSMFTVLSGTVRITIPSVQGKQIILPDLHAGQVFGEIALFDGGSRSADAIALTNCELAVLERRDILPVLTRHPEACLKLLELISRRLRHTDELMIDLLFFDLPGRLAKALLSKVGAAHGQSAAKLGLSQQELGNLVGARRESVNRCLQAWQRLGIVQLKRGWIVILAPEKLRQIANPETDLR